MSKAQTTSPNPIPAQGHSPLARLAHMLDGNWAIEKMSHEPGHEWSQLVFRKSFDGLSMVAGNAARIEMRDGLAALQRENAELAAELQALLIEASEYCALADDAEDEEAIRLRARFDSARQAIARARVTS